jgi:hypothetical protein
MTNNITFIIAAQLDCSDRLDNLDITLSRLQKDFPDAPIILLEADSTNKLKGRYANVEHIYSQLFPGEVFNKMKLYNKGAALANTSVLCFVDVDVPLSKTAILKGFQLITDNIYDVVYPYGKAEGYNIPKEVHSIFAKQEDVYSYDTDKYPWLSKNYQMPYVESGGIVLFNSAAYCYGGGGNENFVGWGCEDDEMLSRFSGLCYRLGRIDDAILIHLQHERRANPLWYDYAKYEKANRQRLADVRAMSKEQLSIMVKSWNNFGNPVPKKEDITVIISASYLDAHPEITFIKEVVDSLDLAGLPNNTPVILSHDLLKPGIEGYEDKQKAYDQYFKNLEEYINGSPRNLKIVKAPEWGHLTRTLKNAVSQVTTKYMLVLQHDIHIRREIPVLKIIELMERYKHIKHLRFNVRKNLPTFGWWDGHRGGSCVFAEEEYDGVKLCVTPAWSDQNHIATKEYYETVVFPGCTGADGELIYDFMENKLNGLCHYNHSKYGTYIYGEYGLPRTSRHSDGRKSSPEKDED